MLACVEEDGNFDADAVVIVLSKHDYADAPTFAPSNPNTHPTQTPAMELGEAISRYLPQVWSPAALGAACHTIWISQGDYNKKASLLIDSAAAHQTLRDREAMQDPKADGKGVYLDKIHLIVKGQEVPGELISRPLIKNISLQVEKRPHSSAPD